MPPPRIYTYSRIAPFRQSVTDELESLFIPFQKDSVAPTAFPFATLTRDGFARAAAKATMTSRVVAAEGRREMGSGRKKQGGGVAAPWRSKKRGGSRWTDERKAVPWSWLGVVEWRVVYRPRPNLEDGKVRINPH